MLLSSVTLNLLSLRKESRKWCFKKPLWSSRSCRVAVGTQIPVSQPAAPFRLQKSLSSWLAPLLFSTPPPPNFLFSCKRQINDSPQKACLSSFSFQKKHTAQHRWGLAHLPLYLGTFCQDPAVALLSSGGHLLRQLLQVLCLPGPLFSELAAQLPDFHCALGIASGQQLSLLAIKFKTVDRAAILGLLDGNCGFLGAFLEIKQLHVTFRKRDAWGERDLGQQPLSLFRVPQAPEKRNSRVKASAQGQAVAQLSSPSHVGEVLTHVQSSPQNSRHMLGPCRLTRPKRGACFLPSPEAAANTKGRTGDQRTANRYLGDRRREVRGWACSMEYRWTWPSVPALRKRFLDRRQGRARQGMSAGAVLPASSRAVRLLKSPHPQTWGPWQRGANSLGPATSVLDTRAHVGRPGLRTDCSPMAWPGGSLLVPEAQVGAFLPVERRTAHGVHRTAMGREGELCRGPQGHRAGHPRESGLFRCQGTLEWEAAFRAQNKKAGVKAGESHRCGAHLGLPTGRLWRNKRQDRA